METLKFVKNNDGHYYHSSKIKNNTIDIIHAALEDGMLDFDFISDWIRNSQFSSFCSNLCAFVKVGDRLFITRNDVKSTELDCYFDISQVNFLELVDQWRKISKEKPEEIVIKNSEGDFSIECNL